MLQINQCGRQQRVFTGHCGRMRMFAQQSHEKRTQQAQWNQQQHFPIACTQLVTHRTSTGGHRWMEPTHQHSLDIHSIQAHIGHTPALHSWENKHIGHLDYTHCLPLHFHHRGKLEEEKEGYKMLTDKIVLFGFFFFYLNSTKCFLKIWKKKTWKNQNN